MEIIFLCTGKANLVEMRAASFTPDKQTKMPQEFHNAKQAKRSKRPSLVHCSHMLIRVLTQRHVGGRQIRWRKMSA